MEKLTIGAVPAVVYGSPSERVWLYVHGKQGRKEEALSFSEELCPNGWQVISIDMPGHGERAKDGLADFDPWHVVPELRAVMAAIRQRWKHVALRATSIGAWFSMLAFADTPPERALFVSPVLDMERLISQMMGWAGVSEAGLQERGVIPTNFGETLDWQYLQYVKAHPIQRWDCPTAILYAGGDTLTQRETAETFAKRFGCELTVYAEGEHWFHTPEQLRVLRDWERQQTREPIEVVAAVIRDGARFLACQRPEQKARGGLWEFVGGKVEPGETRQEALVRECREELSLTLSVDRLFCELTYRYPDIAIHLSVFQASIAAGTPRLMEHRAMRWVTAEEAAAMPFCPADQEIIEKLRER